MYRNTLDALLLENALEMILGYDEKGVILFANQAAKDMLGYGDALIGMNLRHVVKPMVRQNRIAFRPNLKEKNVRFLGKNNGGFYAVVRLIEAEGEEDISFLLAMRKENTES